MTMTIKPDMSKIWASAGATAVPPDLKIASGWGYEMMPFEWENWIQNRNDSMLSYLNQRGIAEWDSTTEYFTLKSYVTGSDGVVYYATADSVGVNPVGDLTGKWLRAFASVTGGGASGTWNIGISGNSATTTKLATARSVSITGDATWSVSFDGTADVTNTLTLANTGIAAGTVNNSATSVTPITFDAKGRATVTGAPITITPAWGSVTGKPTTIAGYNITDVNNYAPTLTGVGATGTWGISVTGNSATSSKWVTPRLISATGDATWSVSVDGSSNASSTLTLANTGVASGMYKNVVVDTKGRVLSGDNLEIPATPVVEQSDIGTAPNQVPINQFLSPLAYRDENPAGSLVGTSETQVLSNKSFTGNTGFGTATPTRLVDIADDGIRVRSSKTPASATAAGNTGDICWDASYVYVCVATNTWKRSALTTW